MQYGLLFDEVREGDTSWSQHGIDLVIDAISAHPLATWLARGLSVCINTDNTLLSNVTATQEHRRMAAHLSTDQMAQVIAAGHAAAFAH